MTPFRVPKTLQCPKTGDATLDSHSRQLRKWQYKEHYVVDKVLIGESDAGTIRIYI